MPKMKQPIIIKGLFEAKLSGVDSPLQINKKMKIGISNAMAKARKIEIMKSR